MKDPLATDMLSESLLDLSDIVPVHTSTPIKPKSPILGGTARRFVRRLFYKLSTKVQCRDLDNFKDEVLKSQDPEETFFERSKNFTPGDLLSEDLEKTFHIPIEFSDVVPVRTSTPIKSKSPILGDTACHVVKRLSYNLSEKVQSRDLDNIKDEVVTSQDPDETWFERIKNVTPDDLQSEGLNNTVHSCSKKRSSTILDINLDDFSFPSDRSDELLTSYDRLPKWREAPSSPLKLRGKKRMALLPGHTCRDCEGILDDTLVQKVSRHRALHKRAPTPKGFWDMDMPSTQHILDRQLGLS